MFELFRSKPATDSGKTIPGQWPYLERGLKNNLHKVQQYYRVYNPTLRAEHFLVRLLQSLAVPQSLPLERYYENVDTISLTHSMRMGMSSSIGEGVVFRGVFYGAGMPELLIATDDPFDFEQVHLNWRTVSAVTVLTHPKSDLELHLPNGDSYSAERGLCVILINITMLAVQYRAFVLEQLKNPDNSSRTIMQFIAGHVLTNMLDSHLEISLFNRLYKRAYGIDDGSSNTTRQHSFGLTNYDGIVDNTLDKVLEAIGKSKKEFNSVLNNIPSVRNESMHLSLMMPDIAPTRQVNYVLVAARLKVMDFLMRICEPETKAKNQQHLNQMQRAFSTSGATQLFRTRFPADVQRELFSYLETYAELEPSFAL